MLSQQMRTLFVRTSPLLLAGLVLMAGPSSVEAQRGGGAPAAPASPRTAAPIDITGTWHTVIVDDFRFRATPQKGDIEYLPLTDAARRAAGQWDPDRDRATGQQCRAYGAVGVMQQPGRVRISWADDVTLKLEFDSGTQTRLFHFGSKPAQMPKPSLQGYSSARWLTAGRGRGAGPMAAASGELEVVTTGLLPGYIRKNGVPHSGDAVYTEYFYLMAVPGGQPYLTVTTSVADPVNLTQPFIYAYHLRRQADDTGWAPTPCWNK